MTFEAVRPQVSANRPLGLRRRIPDSDNQFTEFRICELQGEQAFLSLREDWDRLWREDSHSTGFQCWDWQYYYWKHVIPQNVPRIITLRDAGGRCWAIGAFARTRDPITGVLSWSFIGGRQPDYNQFLTCPDLPDDVLLSVLRDTMRRFHRSASAVNYMRVPEECQTGRQLKRLHAEDYHADHLAELSTSPSFAIPLPTTFEAYLSSLSANVRGQTLNKQRRLQKQYRVEFRVCESPDETTDLLDHIKQIDLARWGTSSKYHIRSQCEFHAALIPALSEKGLLRAFLLCLNGRPCAYLLGMLAHGTLVADLLAYDPSVNPKLSVGRIANLMAIEACIARNVRCFDLTVGNEAYKEHLGCTPRQCVQFRLYRSSMDRLSAGAFGKLLRTVRQQVWLRNVCRRYLR